MSDDTDPLFSEIEASLSDREKEFVDTLQEQILARANPDIERVAEKARRAALLSVEMDRESAHSIELLQEGIDDPNKIDSEDVANALSKDTELSREHRELLEDIGVYPL